MDNRPVLQPFRSGTRQRHAKIGYIPFAASQQGSYQVPQVGMLSRIIAQLRGTVTFSNTTTLADQGPWSLVNRLQLNTNIGAALLFDCSGYGAFVLMRTLQRGWSPDVAGGGSSTTANTDIYAWPTSGSAQAFCLTWEVPVSVNDGGNFETGLINLQSPETRVTMQTTFGALTDGSSLVTAITANMYLYYEYYEIGDPRVFALPALTLSRYLEENQPITAVGDNVYTVPRMGMLINLIHVVTLNAARSDSIDSFAVRFNKTDIVYQDDRQWHRVEERRLYGLLPNTGVYYYDFFHAYSEVNRGDTRDGIDTEALTTLESFVTVTSTATLGNNTNTLKSIRRVLQIIG